MHIGDGKNTPS
jgi:hypothetical protein